MVLLPCRVFTRTTCTLGVQGCTRRTRRSRVDARKERDDYKGRSTLGRLSPAIQHPPSNAEMLGSEGLVSV